MSSKIIVTNPATGELIGELDKYSKEKVIGKIEEGDKAFKTWAKINAHKRSELLKAWSSKIEEQKEDIAYTMTIESGKALKESRAELDYARSYIDWYAEEAKRIYGRTIPSNTESKRIVVTKEPVGLVGAVTSWNFPAAMMTRKVAPALAAGCTIIVKPSVESPLTTIKLISLAYKVGIPEDVLQYVVGSGRDIGELFTSHPLIRKITFTGSTPVGKKLIKDSADTIKHVSMELGGHAPLIINEDADLDYAVEQAVASKFRNAGQTCICANRLIVHENISSSFAKKFTEAVRQLKVGNGLEENTDVGPVINRSGYEKVHEQVQDAIDKGAELLTGHTYNIDEEKNYYFVDPTVLLGVTAEMDIMQEETFGPVAPLTTFRTIDEAIEIANSTPFGLAAYFFTNDYRTGLHLHENLKFGIVGWNDGAPSAAYAPFGGMKESGLGREGGIEGIEPYLETKYLSIGNL